MFSDKQDLIPVKKITPKYFNKNIIFPIFQLPSPNKSKVFFPILKQPSIILKNPRTIIDNKPTSHSQNTISNETRKISTPHYANPRSFFKINYRNKSLLKNNSNSIKTQIAEKMKENLNVDKLTDKSIILKKGLNLRSKPKISSAVVSEKNEIVMEIKHILNNLQHKNENEKIDNNKILNSNKGNKKNERENSISRNFKKKILEMRISQKNLARSVNLEKNSEIEYGRKASEIDAKILGEKIQWKKGDLLGHGTFGNIYRALDCNSGRIFAVKTVQLSSGLKLDQLYIDSVKKELNVLKETSHPNIIQFYDYEEFNDTLYIYLEYMSGGSLGGLIKKFGPFTEETIKIYSQQILSALQYLHNKKIVHKDLKGDNILVSIDGKVKLADFGCAQKLEKTLTLSIDNNSPNFENAIVGSIPWMAPEVLQQTKNGKKADIWSFGCVLIELITGKMPWYHLKFENPIAAIMKIATSNEIPEIGVPISESFKDFIGKCLCREREKRWSVDQLLEHEFLRE